MGFSCTSEEEVAAREQSSIDLKNITIDFSNVRAFKELLLFDYEDASDISKKMNSSLVTLIMDSKDVIKENEKVSDIFINISISNGKAVITEITQANANTKKIIASIKLDDTTGDYQQRTAPYEDYMWSCPGGYEFIGGCSNLGGSEEMEGCIGSYAASYYSANLSGIGDCASVMVHVGTFSTQVCGATC
ncbi:hypothetical protein NBRC110019_20700 [Neptunitalea chrysea]|uniref:Uncharacterized protein n=2 Tax=Neptunitalea chrysea TaxID=1647581 RepID=A0A9W6EU47_9FLAO|nr:hypothetical protein NBRC110019_20700 [Neptunitalea chrysea]